MTEPRLHVADEWLMEYAAGTLGEAACLAIACHLASCQSCRARDQELQRLGGALLAAAPVAPLDDRALERVLARLDQPPPAAPDAAALDQLVPGVRLPRALRAFVPANARWRRLAPGVRTLALPVAPTQTRCRLVQLAPGLRIPWHDHRGLEWTVVFAGGLDGSDVAMRAGDILVRAPGERHDQVASPGEPCVALSVNEAPLRPLTARGWLLELLTGG